MPRRKDKKATGVEYCRGYVDEHGQWNNGFYCPQWGGPGRKYCCGLETHRFCCPEETTPPDNSIIPQRLPVMLGMAVGCIVVAMLTLVITCYFCRCCWLYRRRKRLRHDGPPNISGGPVDYAVNYTVCPHSTYPRDGATSCYPLDDPPPYPGEPTAVSEEKQPLNPTQLCVAIDGPEDVTNPVTFSLNRRSPPGGDNPSSSSSSALEDHRIHNHGTYRHAPRHPPHHCYHDRVTIFSNIGALGRDRQPTGEYGRTRTQLPRPRQPREFLRFQKEDRNLLISRGNPDMEDRGGGCSEQLQEALHDEEQLTGLPSTSNSGNYTTSIDDFINPTNGFTALTRSQTFTLQERGGIELTTFKSQPSCSEHHEEKTATRKSIELGSFFRSPLGGDTDYSFVHGPSGGTTENVNISRSYGYPSCLQNGDVFRLSAEAMNEDEDDLTDLTIQVIPQG